MTDECIFCKIIKKEIPATLIYENNNAIAFLDIAPINPGHTLVVSKQHFETLDKAPDAVLADMMAATKKVAAAVEKAVNADGANIIINNKKAAGQLVSHLHLHIIPRFENDGLKHWPGKKYKEGEAEQVAEKIRSLLK